MPLVVSKPSKIDLEQRSNYNLIRYQMGKALNAKDIDEKANEVKKLKDLVSLNDSNVKRVKFPAEQSDAAEFVTPLFEALNLTKPLITVSKLTPVKDGQKYQQKESKGEEQVSTSLPIKNSKNKVIGNRVSELSKYYNGVEELSDDESAFFDLNEGGSQKVKTNKELTSFVKQGSTEIVMSLKRFDNYGNKIKDHIILDNFDLPVVDLNNFGKSEDNSTTIYNVDVVDKTKKVNFEPTAFIVHDGDSMQGGHYYTFVKEKDNKWYQYNDSYRTCVDNMPKVSFFKNPDTGEEIGHIQKDARERAGKKVETETLSALEYNMRNAYIVKYSTAGKDGKISLPDSQVATKNPSNACWVNAATVFAGAFTSFEHCKNATLSKDEEVTYKSVTKTLPANQASNKLQPKVMANSGFIQEAKQEIKMFKPQMMTLISEQDDVSEHDSKIVNNYTDSFVNDVENFIDRNPSVSEKKLKEEVSRKTQKFLQKVIDDVKDDELKETFEITRDIYAISNVVTNDVDKLQFANQQKEKLSNKSSNDSSQIGSQTVTSQALASQAQNSVSKSVSKVTNENRVYRSEEFKRQKQSVIQNMKKLGFDEQGNKINKINDALNSSNNVEKVRKTPSTSIRLRDRSYGTSEFSKEKEAVIQRLIDLGFDVQGNKVR